MGESGVEESGVGLGIRSGRRGVVFAKVVLKSVGDKVYLLRLVT